MSLICALYLRLGYSYFGEVRLGHSFILAILYEVIDHICRLYSMLGNELLNRVILIMRMLGLVIPLSSILLD